MRSLSVKSVTQTTQKIKVNLREHQDDTLELVITTGKTITNNLPEYEAPFATYELIVSPGDEIEIVPKSAVLYIQVTYCLPEAALVRVNRIRIKPIFSHWSFQ